MVCIASPSTKHSESIVATMIELKELSKPKLLGRSSIDVLEFCEHYIFRKEKRLKCSIATYPMS